MDTPESRAEAIFFAALEQPSAEARALGEADVKAIEQLMRDRGEQHMIAIGGRDANHAEVEASIGDMTRYQGTRLYQLALTQGAWRIESMTEHPNMSRF